MKTAMDLLRQCRRVGSWKGHSQLRSAMQGRARSRKIGYPVEQIGATSADKLYRGFGTTSPSDNSGGAGIPCNARLTETILGSNSVPLLTAAVKDQFFADGFVRVDGVLGQDVVEALKARYDRLFRGDFETGIFPDEWHWREGLSLPDVTREIVNGWKCDKLVASVVRSPAIGRLVADLMGWEHGTRVGQDSVLWKPAGAGGVTFHQDSVYISDQFHPREANSATVWIALDDADDETGVVEYAAGSHHWSTSALSSMSDTAFHGNDDVHAPLYRAAERCGVPAAHVSLKSVTVPAGSCIIHHQDVWHGSRANVSRTRPRRALALHLIRADVQFRQEPPVDYIYGRYVVAGSVRLEDTFFPWTWWPEASLSGPL